MEPPTGQVSGIEVSDDRALNQRNDLFTRVFGTHKSNRKTRTLFLRAMDRSTPRRGDGFSHKDFALRNAAGPFHMVSERSASAGKREGFQAPLSPPMISALMHKDDVPAFTDE